MWVEWTIGRYGGVHGHGTTPGMFSLMWKNRAAKYLGAIGIAMPFVDVVIGTVTNVFAIFSFNGKAATGGILFP